MESQLLLTPVVTEASHSVGPIIIGFIIIGILVGLSLYLYAMNHHNEYDQGGGHMPITVSNETDLPHTISLPSGQEVDIDPKQEVRLALGQHDALVSKVKNYDGTLTSHHYRLSNPKIQKVHLTPSGFHSNISGSDNVTFVNQTPDPLMFIEKSHKGGRRWGVSVVPPFDSSDGHFVGKRSIWQVAHPTMENEPLDQKTIGGKINKLIFDGQHLKVQ